MCPIQSHAGAAEWPVYENASDCNKFQSLQQKKTGEMEKSAHKHTHTLSYDMCIHKLKDGKSE